MSLDAEKSTFPLPSGSEAKYETENALTNDSATSNVPRDSSVHPASESSDSIVKNVPVSNLDQEIVGWDGEDDPSYPRNFTPALKWRLIGLLAVMDLLTPLASSMFAPALGFMDESFHNTSGVLSPMVVTIFVLGFVFGPLVLAPLSEIYGRRIILSASNVVFIAFQLGCALAPSIGALITFRFFAGIGGSGVLAVGGGVIADLFLPHERGLATSVYSLGPLIGPIIGPIIGGFLAQRAGWRWIYWVLFISSSIMTLIILLLNRESNHAVLIQRKTERLRKELAQPELRSIYDIKDHVSHKSVLLNALIRPLQLLFTSIVVLILCLDVAIVYGLSFLLFTTMTALFQDTYGWSPEICGLAYLGIGVGMIVGIAIVAKISDKTVIRLTAANHGQFEPEMRIPACVFFACFIPISFFTYGWTAQAGVYWLVPIICLLPFGFGMIGVMIPITAYLIDAFPEYSASAIAAGTTSRSLFGAVLALAGPSLYDRLGYGWGNSILGFITLMLVPATVLVARYGKQWRRRYPVNL